MSFKIVTPETFIEKAQTDPNMVTLNQIRGVVNNYYSSMRKVVNSAVTNMDVRTDSKSAWFSKESIDKLFADNKGSDGLRIYFGVHNGVDIQVAIPEYKNQMMTVLVTTTSIGDKNDNIDLDNLVEIAGAARTATVGGGDGMDNGTLCPPNPHCSGAKI